jgi:L-fuculose-phosphate aldolase
LAALVDGARRVAQAGLVLGSAGNVSLRTDDRILITRRGCELDALVPEDCVEVTLDRAAVANGVGSRTPQPSSELPLHSAIYAATEAGAIVHTHSHYATVLGTIVHELPAVHYAVIRFGGPVRVAPYRTFGTEELARVVIDALEDRTAALMANHGAVAIGRDMTTAVSTAIHLEWLASIYYHAILCGTPSILSSDELDGVRERVRELARGVGAGAR